MTTEQLLTERRDSRTDLAPVLEAALGRSPKSAGRMVCIEIGGESITRPGRDPDEEEGGEG